MFGGPTSTPDTAKVLVKVLGPNAIGARYKGREKPVGQKIAQQELVARHVPKEYRLPFVDGASILCQEDERTITSAGIEPSV